MVLHTTRELETTVTSGREEKKVCREIEPGRNGGQNVFYKRHLETTD